MSAARAYKSKTIATWIALVGGGLGLHRFYLHGLKDRWGWLCLIPTALGLWGVERVQAFGQDDQMAWILVPLLGLILAATMLTAIVYGLMPDEKWNARYNPDGPDHHSGWATVFGVAVALFIGAGVLMATLAFSGQRYFEYQVEEARKISQDS
ncbi:MAG: transrane protein [Rhizobacter sp.]|jgi:hypothetical protein|nr:transrane protein [Rhizobacter sp.]